MRLFFSGRASARKLAYGSILLAALPFVVVPAAGDPLQAPRALVASLACALCALSAFPTRADARSRRALAAVAALLGWLVLAAVVNGLPSAVWGVHGRFQGLVTWALLFAAGYAGWAALHRDVRRFAAWLSAAGAVEAAYVLVVVLVSGERAGTGGNQAVTAGWLAVSACVAAAAGRASRARGRALHLSAAALMLAALGVLGSRGAWAGLAAAGGVLVFARRDNLLRRLVPAALAVGLVAAAAFAAGGESALKLAPGALASGSGAARISIWGGTARMIADHPMTGVGPGRFLYSYPAYDPLRRARLEPGVRADQAHGLFLQLAAEGGIPAAVLLAVLVALAASAGVRGIRARDGTTLVAAAGFAAYLGQGLFGVAAIETDVLGWALGGALLARAAALGTTAGAASREPRVGPLAQWAVLGGLGVALAAAVASYVVVDLRYGAELRALAGADFASATTAARSAVATNPLVDVYRVGVADAAAYAGGDAARHALGVIEAGLDLEPRSYDLALARARLLRASAASEEDVAEAYGLAVRLWPYSIDAGREGALAYARAGRRAKSRALAKRVLAVSPGDRTSLALLDGAGP